MSQKTRTTFQLSGVQPPPVYTHSALGSSHPTLSDALAAMRYCSELLRRNGVQRVHIKGFITAEKVQLYIDYMPCLRRLKAERIKVSNDADNCKTQLFCFAVSDQIEILWEKRG